MICIKQLLGFGTNGLPDQPVIFHLHTCLGFLQILSQAPHVQSYGNQSGSYPSIIIGMLTSTFWGNQVYGHGRQAQEPSNLLACFVSSLVPRLSLRTMTTNSKEELERLAEGVIRTWSNGTNLTCTYLTYWGGRAWASPTWPHRRVCCGISLIIRGGSASLRRFVFVRYLFR